MQTVTTSTIIRLLCLLSGLELRYCTVLVTRLGCKSRSVSCNELLYYCEDEEGGGSLSPEKRNGEQGNTFRFCENSPDEHQLEKEMRTGLHRRPVGPPRDQLWAQKKLCQEVAGRQKNSPGHKDFKSRILI